MHNTNHMMTLMIMHHNFSENIHLNVFCC